MRISKLLAALAATAIVIAGCSDRKGWSVSGHISGADGSVVVLEKADNGVWLSVDSALLGSDGNFSFTKARPKWPEIYRLQVDGRALYFPVDSVEDITVDADAATLDSKGRIAGSLSAETMQGINDLVNAAVETAGLGAFATDDAMKRRVAQLMQAEWDGIASYYAINKVVEGVPLFDPSRPFDRRIIAAVANAFVQNRPDDPRTELLRNTTLSQRRAYGSPAGDVTMQAVEVPFIDIAEPDIQGRIHRLSDLWKSSKATVLCFTLYGQPELAQWQLALGEAWDAYKEKGLGIFQVACNDAEHEWRTLAADIPWVSVYNSPARAAANLVNYNVATFPTVFVIDRNADRIERVTDPASLSATIERNL